MINYSHNVINCNSVNSNKNVDDIKFVRSYECSRYVRYKVSVKCIVCMLSCTFCGSCNVCHVSCHIIARKKWHPTSFWHCTCFRVVLFFYLLLLITCLQCFDAVGWAAGRASGLEKTEWWGAGVVICLERGADLHMVQLMPLPLPSCSSKIQTGFTFLVPAHLGSPGKRAVKSVCVCLLLIRWFCPQSTSGHWMTCDVLLCC